MSDESLDALSRCGLFSGLPADCLKALHTSGKEMAFAAGETLINEGEDGGRFFLILDGEAEVSKGGATRALLGCGDAVGELSLIDGEPRTATVVAKGPVRAFTLASWNFKAVVREHNEIADRVMQFLARRLRAAENPVVD